MIVSLNLELIVRSEGRYYSSFSNFVSYSKIYVCNILIKKENLIFFRMKVFKVNRHGERDRFMPFKELHNRRLLWHGSRTTNYAGILSQGLRIAPPEAPVVGTLLICDPIKCLPTNVYPTEKLFPGVEWAVLVEGAAFR